MESVAALNNWMLLGALIFAAITGVLLFLANVKSRSIIQQLSKDLEASNGRIKSLEKTAGSIRKDLLRTQQYQDISKLKLKTSNSSAEELRMELLTARKRLAIAEAAIKERKEQEKNTGAFDDLGLEMEDDLELELEPELGLSESQREQLIDLLDPGPKGNVDVFCVMGDEMSEATARQMDEILTNDGWKTNGVAQSAFTNPPKGFLLVVNSKETAPSYASFMQRVFTTIGFDVSAKVDTKFREWSLSIVVGTIDG
jgi:hypothetical protein